MALHHELPVYRDTYALLQESLLFTQNMPREYKRSVGEKLRTELAEMTVLIFRANVSTDKVPHIQALRERLQVVELLLRMSCDMHWISEGQYARAVLLTDSIGKQSTGWAHASSKRTPAV